MQKEGLSPGKILIFVLHNRLKEEDLILYLKEQSVLSTLIPPLTLL